MALYDTTKTVACKDRGNARTDMLAAIADLCRTQWYTIVTVQIVLYMSLHVV
jgi:hypothetical protein